MKKLHIAITSILFDKKPEGICTGRLVRALLASGHRVTLLTSTKEGSSYTHPRLQKVVVSHRPREPRWLFKFLAKLQGGIYNNFYMWSRAVAKYDFKGDIPDVFYSRAWPHASLVPAYELSQKHGRPLILHFSDPFPAPNEDIVYDQRFFDDLQKMVNAASALTFTNKETISYQAQYVSFDTRIAHVLNHIAPEPMVFGGPGVTGAFYHVGGVGPSRSPVPLLDGFAIHVKRHPESRLFFVGAIAKYVEDEIRRRDLADVVSVLPFTNDVQGVFRRAGVLLSIDNKVTPPLFTPTKIVEYLVTDRPVLSITPPDSPVMQLIARSPETGVAVVDYAPEAVAAGFDAALSLMWSEALYQERIKSMQDFNAGNVVRQFESIVQVISK